RGASGRSETVCAVAVRFHGQVDGATGSPSEASITSDAIFAPLRDARGEVGSQAVPTTCAARYQATIRTAVGLIAGCTHGDTTEPNQPLVPDSNPPLLTTLLPSPSG